MQILNIKKFGWLALCLLLLSGCVMNMRDQPRHEPLEASSFFEDGRSARPLVENTVARGHLQVDRHLYEGLTEEGDFVESFPFPITREVLERGQNRYQVFCSPCHSSTGNGQGMVVQRGMPQSTSFHDDRLLEAQNGYYFNVISNGFGKMYGYASRVKPEDRWAIVAYIRALQLSQNATVQDVPPEKMDELKASEAFQE